MGEAAVQLETAVRIDALVKRYGALLALDNVSLSVAPREAFGLVGANGAGKTTLIRCLLDLTACDAGAIRIFGVAARAPASRARLVYLPERFMPPHYLTGREFLRTLAVLAGTDYDEARAVRMAAELELERDALERPVRSLSKGMTQKRCSSLPMYWLTSTSCARRSRCSSARGCGFAAPRKRFAHATARRAWSAPS
jgi:ABC-2 type transport system ATP-binding protein